MNKKSTGDMDTDIEKAVIYLKNYVATTSTTHINLSSVYIYL